MKASSENSSVCQPNKRVLVTGATGFVGKRVCEVLREAGHEVTAAARLEKGGCVGVGNIDGQTDWRAALQDCQAVIHLAARVHVMNDTAEDPLQLYREVNLHGTVNLARQAAAAGVRRFVFISSVKVNGESTARQPFSERDQPKPVDPYGQSKLEAELALREIGRTTGMEIVVIRPPLVYGPAVKANFRNLIKLVGTGLPLPFGRVDARRSMVALDNLADLIVLCMTHPLAPGGTFMVSDGRDLTVGEIATMIAQAMGKRLWLLPVPAAWMRGVARLLGKSSVADRLFGSLEVDMSMTRSRLGWTPPVSAREAIEATVSDFLGRPAA